MTRITDQLRDKDQIVLQAIQSGEDDVQKITETTILENHGVNYCFTKLQDLGLIEVEKPDGYTTRTINGQKRVFQTPKQAQLTEKGQQYLNQSTHQDLEGYENLSHRELVEKVHKLENELERLERSFNTFQTQVKSGLDSN